MDTMSISQTPALQTLVERGGGDYSVCQLTSNTACNNNFSEHLQYSVFSFYLFRKVSAGHGAASLERLGLRALHKGTFPTLMYPADPGH